MTYDELTSKLVKNMDRSNPEKTAEICKQLIKDFTQDPDTSLEDLKRVNTMIKRSGLRIVN